MTYTGWTWHSQDRKEKKRESCSSTEHAPCVREGQGATYRARVPYDPYRARVPCDPYSSRVPCDPYRARVPCDPSARTGPV